MGKTGSRRLNCANTSATSSTDRSAEATRQPSAEPCWELATWMVMGRKRRLHRASTPGLATTIVTLVYALVIVVTVLITTVSSADCKLTKCSDKYSDKINNDQRHIPIRRFCQALYDYNKCVMGISPRTCRGELNYHSTLIILPDLIENNNCDEILAQPEGSGSPFHETTTPPRVRGSTDQCVYRGKEQFKSCSLFGDPHLRTFDGSFQTCRVAGAWPVFYNKYVAAQVTNVQLLHGSGATATTKLSVIIKEHAPCAQEKLYLAQTGNLPGAFVDGTRNSGPKGRGVFIIEVVPEKHVEIHIRYIGTVIVVRQIGEYLLFSVRMPEQIIKRRGPEDLQLCVRGCPGQERIDYVEFLTQSRDVDQEKLQLAIDKCRRTDAIDVYLDSCVFDLLTTSDDNFTNAAESALRDISRLQPNASLSLHNRTSVFEDSKIWNELPHKRSGAPPRTRRSAQAVSLAIALVALWASHRLTTCHHFV